MKYVFPQKAWLGSNFLVPSASLRLTNDMNVVVQRCPDLREVGIARLAEGTMKR